MANNVKADLQVIGYKGANWVHGARNGVKWSAAVNTVMTPQLHGKRGTS